MSTIKSRWKWIRRQAFLILVLIVVALFPSLPRETANLVNNLFEKSGLYESGTAIFQNRLSQDAELASNERNGSGSEKLIYEASMPVTELQFSADRGNHLAQYRLLKNAGVDLSDLDGYLQSLYEKQPAPVQSQ